MLKGTRQGVVERIQPTSVHGQPSLDVFWIDPDDPDQELRHARLAPESVPPDLAPGDRVAFEYVMGSVVEINRIG